MADAGSVRISGLEIGPDSEPVIAAEMSGNHNGQLDRALAIVDAVADTGAQMLKLQTYTADTITLDVEAGDFVIDDADSLWSGRSLHSLYADAYTPWEWHAPIFDRCRERGLVCFSSPFDESAVDYLEELGAPCYKIASFENVHLPLIRKAASTGKPLIISAGMATVAELGEAVATAREAGCTELVLLKCTSTYPASPGNSNVRTIPHMAELFGCQVGLSDHTLGLGVAVAAVAMGATFIEKHVTLSRADGGVDSAFSAEPAELSALVSETRRAWQSLGKVSYGATGAEKKSLQLRRSLFVAEDMAAGDEFTEANLRVVRPGTGLPPKFFEAFLSRRVNKDVRKGTPVSWDLLG